MEQQEPTPPETSATVIRVKQTVRPGGFDTSNAYNLDGELRQEAVPIFGAVSMRANYVSAADISKEDTMNYEIERPIFTDDRIAIREMTVGVNTGWEATTLWGFQQVNGERRFCKYCTTTKGDQKVQVRLIYDYRPLSAAIDVS